ncbi:hypothetical protein ACIO3O_24300 [Streptomyces sp. NPDC087440]|uniref:hypothetical protein n=1 Tax=Streptomyces sp. NPDC087440 TaxID=3365790 RepID=UPI00381DAB19
MTPEMTQQDQRRSERATTYTTKAAAGGRAGKPKKIGNLEVWARSAPIRLAGYEDDLAEPHILPGVD